MVNDEAEEVGRYTCFPMMPIQAIDEVVMVDTGEQQTQMGWRCWLSAGYRVVTLGGCLGALLP